LPHEHIDDALFENMQRFFNKQEISLLTLVIAQINTWNRIQQVVRTKPGEYKVRG